jgi:Tol biopolymer transport system component
VPVVTQQGWTYPGTRALKFLYPRMGVLMEWAYRLCILALLAAPGSVSAAGERSPVIRRVWVGPKPGDFDDTWAVSSDGRYLAFRDSESRIGVYDLRASRLRSLPVKLPEQQWRAGFSWSPDRSQLAFNRSSGQGEELVTVDIRRARQRVLKRVEASVAPIGWSADGQRIAVAIERGTSVELSWVSLRDGALQQITTVSDAVRNGRPFSAVLSPDSKLIAFTRFTNDRSRDIFTIHHDGTGEVAVVEHQADDYPVAYTKDGQLLFASDRSGSMDLWSIRASADSQRPWIPRQIMPNLGVIQPLAITKTAAIYYVQSRCSADVLTAQLTSTFDVIPGTVKPAATRFATYNSAPDWSPSGHELVYQIGKPGSPDGIGLAFVSIANGQETVIYPDLLQFSRPRYMPDGNSVVVHGVGLDGAQGIYRINRQTGKSTLVVRSTGEDLVNPIPRSDSLFFEAGGHSWRVLRRGGEAPTDVAQSRTRNANFDSAPSPDGKAVAVVDGSSLIVVPIGEAGREILSLNPPEQFHPFPGSLAWTADGRYVLFGKMAGRQRQVWRIPARGGRAEPIGLSVIDQALYFLRASSDGRKLAFVTGDCDLRPREVWVLEGFVTNVK